MLFPFPPSALPPAVDLTVGQVIEWQQKKCESESLLKSTNKEQGWYSDNRLCELLVEIHDFNSTSAASGASLR